MEKLTFFPKMDIFLSFDFRDGSLNYFNKVSKQGLGAEPIFSNKNMFLVDKKNRLLKFN